MEPLTHDELCRKAATWLKKRHHCRFVVTQKCIMTDEHPDVIGWVGRGDSWLIEVKISRADFVRDAKKFHRQYPEKGMGDYRFYLAPAGIIKREDLKDGWGLLEWDGRKIIKVIESTRQPGKHHKEELRRLISLVVNRNFGCPQADESETLAANGKAVA